MSASVGNVAIRVSDLERSEAFYVGVLGLEVTARVETPDVRELILGSLMLATGGTANAEGIWKVFLDTDDAAALFQHAIAAGAEPVMEPTLLERFNITIAMFRDPDGYLLEVGQRHEN